jgi:multicomponent Na+:H+ antiporter subunit B
MNDMKGMSLIVKTITRITAGPILLFGCYVLMHTNVSHGAGFAGGVIMALSFALLLLAFGRKTAKLVVSGQHITIVALIAFLVLVLLQIIAVQTQHCPLLTAVRNPCSAIVLTVNITLCVTTAAALISVFYSLLSDRSKEK